MTYRLEVGEDEASLYREDALIGRWEGPALLSGNEWEYWAGIQARVRTRADARALADSARTWVCLRDRHAREWTAVFYPRTCLHRLALVLINKSPLDFQTTIWYNLVVDDELLACLLLLRQALLLAVDALERILRIQPRTAELRRAARRQAR